MATTGWTTALVAAYWEWIYGAAKGPRAAPLLLVGPIRVGERTGRSAVITAINSEDRWSSAYNQLMIRLSINVVENRAREILLLRRSPDAHLGAGLWGFPAGRMEQRETPWQCARRELTEEIGAEHRLESISTLGPIRDTFYGGIFEIYLFHHRWLEGRIALNHEHTQYAWVGREIYKRYSVMDGIDEDLAYLRVWPRRFLNQDKLPPR